MPNEKTEVDNKADEALLIENLRSFKKPELKPQSIEGRLMRAPIPPPQAPVVPQDAPKTLTLEEQGLWTGLSASDKIALAKIKDPTELKRAFDEAYRRYQDSYLQRMRR